MCLGIPGRLLSITPHELPIGRVAFGGIVKEVCLAYAPEARVGDYVIVHAGFAISTINSEEAERVLGYLEELGELETMNPATPDDEGVS